MNRQGLTPDEARALAAVHRPPARPRRRPGDEPPGLGRRAGKPAQRQPVGGVSLRSAPCSPTPAPASRPRPASSSAPDYRFDLVRPGISLFGGGPLERPDARLQAVATLTAPILDIRNLRRRRPRGLWRQRARSTAPTRVAVVAAGYADGVIRAAKARRLRLVRRRAPPAADRQHGHAGHRSRRRRRRSSATRSSCWAPTPCSTTSPPPPAPWPTRSWSASAAAPSGSISAKSSSSPSLPAAPDQSSPPPTSVRPWRRLSGRGDHEPVADQDAVFPVVRAAVVALRRHPPVDLAHFLIAGGGLLGAVDVEGATMPAMAPAAPMSVTARRILASPFV